VKVLDAAWCSWQSLTASVAISMSSEELKHALEADVEEGTWRAQGKGVSEGLVRMMQWGARVGQVS